jgi:hypothetical protein
MTDFEDQLRAFMDSAVAGEQPPGNLVERVRHRHRRHTARAAAAGIAVVAAVVGAIPLTGAALGNGSNRAAPPVPDTPAQRATGPVLHGQYYGCASQTFGELGKKWRRGNTKAGPLWFINNGIAPDFNFYNRNGTFKAVPLIVMLRDNATAWVEPAGAVKNYLRFLPGFDSTDQYTVRDGKPEATFTGCSAQNSIYGDGYTEFYIGVIVAGPRCITIDVRTPDSKKPIPVRLTFGKCFAGQ